MKLRVLSAVIAVLALAALYHFFSIKGLLFICGAVAMGCLREYIRLAFGPAHAPTSLRVVFFFACVATFIGALLGDSSALIVHVVSAVIFLAVVLYAVAKPSDLESSLRQQSLGLLGLMYCGLMPALATRLLFFENGDIWLFGLLAIVFAGDTFAYLVGTRFGKTRLLSAVSPKKSVEGALGGLLGSGLAGLCLSVFLPTQTPWVLVGAAVLTGVFAQTGDLFESLLKRVADVKDSGSIMPGHGGILDRCDGVYFAAPVYFILVRILAT